jgi:ribosomal protein S27AE
MICPRCSEPMSILSWYDGRCYTCYKCGYNKSEYIGSDRINNPY